MRTAALIAQPVRRPRRPDAPPTTALADPQTAAVLFAIVESEIAQAHAAEGKARSRRVAELAQAITTRRFASERDLAGFIATLSRGLEQSEMLARLGKDADRVTSSMAGTTGADFDAAYLAGQIHTFERDIAVLDTRLVPDAQAHELERIARELRAGVVENLAAARALRGELVCKAGR